jgi:hypothetical protein
MNVVRRSAMCLALTATIFLGFAATAPVASAASRPSCYGASCEGRDPAATNCNEDARTILSRRAIVEAGDFGHMELRYSTKCHSNWVRFTPWSGLRGMLGTLTAKAEVGGSPWIWRLDVANSLRGTIGRSSLGGATITTWTAMVTADGITCSSVGLHETEVKQWGGGENRSLGTYNAPCIS